MLRLSAIILVSSLLTACCTTEYVSTTVHIPFVATPKLAKLTSEQEANIEEHTYEILVTRELTLKKHIQLLNTLIATANKKPQ